MCEESVDAESLRISWRRDGADWRVDDTGDLFIKCHDRPGDTHERDDEPRSNADTEVDPEEEFTDG